MATRLGHALRTTTARGAKAAVSMMGGGNKAVLTASDFTFLGGFKLPDTVNGSPWADWAAVNLRWTDDSAPAIAVRLVGGNPQLFVTSSSNKGGSAYEVSVPTLSTGAISGWNTASVVTAWGNLYDTYVPGVINRIRAVPSTTTLELQESNHWPDDWFNGMVIKFTSGTLSGQTRGITDHVGSTRVVTVDSSISGAAVNDQYILWNGTCQGSGSTSITLDSNASGTNDAYKYWRVHLIDGSNSGTSTGTYSRTITAYNGTTKVATVDAAWSANPVSGDTKYVLYTCHRVHGGDPDWYLGGLNSGLAIHVKSLFWDETDQRLYHNCHNEYDLISHAPVMGFVKLDDTTKRHTPFGPWRFANSSEKFNRNGFCRIPAAFASTYLSGKDLASGGGGYFSRYQDGSYGPSMGAISAPSAVRNVPTANRNTVTAFPALTDTRMIGYPVPTNTKPGPPYPGRRTSNYRNRDPYGMWTGTVTSVSGNTIGISGAALWKENSAVGDGKSGYYDFDIEFTGGTAANIGQIRNVTSSSWDSANITMGSALPATPAISDTFRTYGGIAQGATQNTITLKANGATGGAAKDWTGYWLAIVDGFGVGQDERLITSYNTTTFVATVSPDWTTIPNSTSKYTPYAIGFGSLVEVWDADPPVGYWTWLDFIHSMTWVENTNRHGILFHGNGGEGFVYYEHSLGLASGGYKAWWHIFDPCVTVPIIQGTQQQYQAVPTEIMADPGSQNNGEALGGMCYDQTNRRLYVMEQRGYQVGGSWHPVVRVYSVAD